MTYPKNRTKNRNKSKNRTSSARRKQPTPSSKKKSKKTNTKKANTKRKVDKASQRRLQSLVSFSGGQDYNILDINKLNNEYIKPENSWIRNYKQNPYFNNDPLDTHKFISEIKNIKKAASSWDNLEKIKKKENITFSYFFGNIGSKQESEEILYQLYIYIYIIYFGDINGPIKDDIIINYYINPFASRPVGEDKPAQGEGAAVKSSERVALKNNSQNNYTTYEHAKIGRYDSAASVAYREKRQEKAILNPNQFIKLFIDSITCYHRNSNYALEIIATIIINFYKIIRINKHLKFQSSNQQNNIRLINDLKKIWNDVCDSTKSYMMKSLTYGYYDDIENKTCMEERFNNRKDFRGMAANITKSLADFSAAAIDLAGVSGKKVAETAGWSFDKLGMEYTFFVSEYFDSIVGFINFRFYLCLIIFVIAKNDEPK